jgi:Mor family transcriptional regulator
MGLSKAEIFEAFYDYCQEHTLSEVIQEYGGGNIYVPSYKALFRDDDIYRDYMDGMDVVALRRKYDLSERSVYKILSKMKRQPSLFDQKTEQE